MAPLFLTYASCRYDRIEPLRSGEVRAGGIDLNVMVFPSGRQIFDRMVGGEEFDASELSASEFVAHAGRGGRVTSRALLWFVTPTAPSAQIFTRIVPLNRVERTLSAMRL